MPRPGKKYEFKPDAPRRELLSRLIPTAQQQKALLKWTLFAGLLLVLLLVQDVVLSRFPIFGVTPDLAGAAILLISVCLGGETGCVFTLISASIYVFSGSAPGYYTMPLLTILGTLAAIFRQAYLRKDFGAEILCAAVALMGYELIVFVINLFLERTHLNRFGIFCLAGALSCAAVPILYPIIRSIGKIGGETWKE